jgi:uncharacterized membrane protein required for colicin V production
MSTADLVFLVVIGLGTLSGFRNGVIKSAFSLAGLTGGALFTALYLPDLLAERTSAETAAKITAVGILLGALIGKSVASLAGKVVRPFVAPLGPLRLLDKALGLVLMTVATSVVCYFLAAGLIAIEGMPWSQSLNDSILLETVNRFSPDFVTSAARSISNQVGDAVAPWLRLKSAVEGLN